MDVEYLGSGRVGPINYNTQKYSQMKRKGSMLMAPAKKPALSMAQSQEVQRQVALQLARKADYKMCRFDIATTVSATGTVFDLLTNLIRGDDALNNFSGQHIQPKNIKIRGQVAAVDQTNAMRVILFQWFDDTPPLPTSILDGALLGTAQGPRATRNWSNRPLYKILRDETYQLQNFVGTTGGLGFVASFDLFSKNMRKVFFAATTAVPQKGGLYCLCVSDSLLVPHPGFSITSELIFTDQ